MITDDRIGRGAFDDRVVAVTAGRAISRIALAASNPHIGFDSGSGSHLPRNHDSMTRLRLDIPQAKSFMVQGNLSQIISRSFRSLIDLRASPTFNKPSADDMR